MSNERPDNEISWGEKLDRADAATMGLWADADAAPEPGAGKDAAWEKLYGRLHGKPRRSIPFWYWMAAACLAGVVYFAAGPMNRGPVSREGMRGAGNGEAKITRSEQPAIISNRPHVADQPDRSDKSDRSDRSPGVSQVYRSHSPRKPPIEPLATTTSIQPSTFPIPDTLATAKLVVPPVRKKLRVISLNELSDPATDESNLAVNGDNNGKNNKSNIAYTHNRAIYTGRPFFQLIRPRDPVIPNTMAASDNTGYQSLKIKLSPQN